MTNEEYAKLLTKVENKYGSEITARFELGVSVSNQLETYIDLNEDDEDFEFDEGSFLEYLTDNVTEYLFESCRSDFDGVRLLTDKGEEI